MAFFQLKSEHLLVVVLVSICLMCLIKQSEQQFSYSAHWGKRSPDVKIGYDIYCKKASLYRDLLVKQALLYVAKIEVIFYKF